MTYTFTLPTAQVNYSIYANPITLDPVQNIGITSVYGYRFISTLEMHAGLDVAAPNNTQIKTVLTSYYMDQGNNSSAPRGYWVRFMLFSDVYVTSQHMISPYTGTTSTNTAISPGTNIGGVGQSGYVTGPHLHIEFYNSSAMTQSSTFDPLRHIYR